MQPVVTIEQLSKKYTLSHIAQPAYHSLRDSISTGVKSIFTKSKKDNFQAKEDFWALKDINLEIRQGERLGIIGRNGAGKSTLLKILSKITEPSSGRIKLRGRVASLLEVGTGFHPELTGRENIFLNGTILGMSRAEIRAKFDEIIAFSEVEKFLDTPVKHYSSGMYVRLAFAVAAHLEPEILIVDEVLAVGDAQFQRKCLGKMEEVSNNQGRTVLFVSHNMATIASLCSRVVLLDKGKIIQEGAASEVILSYYSAGNSSATSVDYTALKQKTGDDQARLLNASVTVHGKISGPEIDIREGFKVEMIYEALTNDKSGEFFPNFHFFNADGSYAFVAIANETFPHASGKYASSCFIPGNMLNEGTYFIGLALTSYEPFLHVHYYEQNALSIHIKDPIDEVPTRGRTSRGNGYAGSIPGVMRPLLHWEINQLK